VVKVLNNSTDLMNAVPLVDFLNLVSAFESDRQSKHERDLEVSNFGGTEFIYPYTQNVYQQIYLTLASPKWEHPPQIRPSEYHDSELIHRYMAEQEKI
jgi:hypothetical protein